MKPFRWSSGKNEVLQFQRGVSFEAVVVAIESGDLLDIVEHPNQARYSGQRILVVLISGYAHLVPYVEADDHLFLKTIIPRRKATIGYRPRRPTMNPLDADLDLFLLRPLLNVKAAYRSWASPSWLRSSRDLRFSANRDRPYDWAWRTMRSKVHHRHPPPTAAGRSRQPL